MPGPTTSAFPRLTGQPFSEAYRRDVLGDRTRLFDSGPATLALTAVALTAPDREFEALKAIQRPAMSRAATSRISPSSPMFCARLSLHEAAERLAASR